MQIHDADIFFEILDFIKAARIDKFAVLLDRARYEPEWIDFIFDHHEIFNHIFDGFKKNN